MGIDHVSGMVCQTSQASEMIVTSFKKTINVCMFSYFFPPFYSGSAIQAVNLANELRNRGIHVSFCTVNHGGLMDKDEFDGFEINRIKEGRGKYGELVLWKNMWSLLKHRQKELDIIHSHGAYLRNSFIGPLSRLLGKKSLAKISLSDNDLNGLGKGKSGWLHRKFISQIDRYVSISKKITEELEHYELLENKIREIPNGVNTDKFYPVSQAEKMVLRKKYDLPEDRTIFLYVGVIDERKNVKWLIDEWKTQAGKSSDLLMVVGPVSREDEKGLFYKSLKANEEIIKDRLRFMEYTDEIEDLYRSADVFILPSTNEGMPNVVLEAMASGLPCLVSNISGTEDLINGRNGILFNSRDRESFYSGMEKLNKPAFRTEVGGEARKSVEAGYSIKNIAEKYIDLYEEMLNGS
jgi:glycosyltransferase involved in cell wall biosynthesis